MLRQVVTYFLLINFLNTICFVDMVVQPPANESVLVQALAVDEVDSLFELLAEMYLEDATGWPGDDMEDADDFLKQGPVIKDYLLAVWQFLPAPVTRSNTTYPVYQAHFYNLSAEVHTPPPQIFS